jgi:phage-related minor tail protein
MGTGNLKDAFKAMIANMISQLIQFFIIDKLTGGIASALFGVKKAVSGGGGGGGVVTGKKAIGGPVQAGSPYMVGERGPEMFVPNQSGSIVPNKKMGGGVTVINNVDARGSGADVDQKIKSAMAQTSQQTIMTIQDLMRRRRFV